MQEFLRELESAAGHGNVLIDHASRLACARGASFASAEPEVLPAAIVRPSQAAQAAKVMTLCARAGQPVSFRGGGTGCAAFSGVVILTDKLNQIYEINRTDQTIQLQPGVTCLAAWEAAAREGLYLPGLPLSAAAATMGGAMACNAAGPDSSRYGFLASRVISLDLWLASGEKTICYGANGLPGKLYPGLPLAQLVAGSTGSTGFIGDMRLQLIPAPAATERLLAAGTLEDIAAACLELKILQPAQLYLLNDLAAGVILGETRALLYTELHEPGQSENARDIFRRRQLTELDNTRAFLQCRPGLAAAVYGKKGPFQTEICAFPASRMASFVAGAEEIAARNGTPIAISGDASCARMQALILPGPQRGAAATAAREFFTLELMLNDALQNEADAALSRQEWQKRRHGGITALSRQICQVFDPTGILPRPGGLA